MSNNTYREEVLLFSKAVHKDTRELRLLIFRFPSDGIPDSSADSFYSTYTHENLECVRSCIQGKYGLLSFTTAARNVQNIATIRGCSKSEEVLYRVLTLPITARYDADSLACAVREGMPIEVFGSSGKVKASAPRVSTPENPTSRERRLCGLRLEGKNFYQIVSADGKRPSDGPLCRYLSGPDVYFDTMAGCGDDQLRAIFEMASFSSKNVVGDEDKGSFRLSGPRCSLDYVYDGK